MKNIWKSAFAAFALLAFTACDSGENTTTESENMDTEMNSEMDMDTEMEEDTTIMLQDTTVDDGVADEIDEEQPPIE